MKETIFFVQYGKGVNGVRLIKLLVIVIHIKQSKLCSCPSVAWCCEVVTSPVERGRFRVCSSHI